MKDLEAYLGFGSRRSSRTCLWLARDVAGSSGILSTALQAICSPSTSYRDGQGSFHLVGGGTSSYEQE